MADVALIRLGPDGATLRLGPFTLTATGLSATGRPTFDEWAHAGAVLKQIGGAVQFWLGDWLAFGEGRYGERVAQALEASPYEEGTLRNCAYVARAIPPSRRREAVPFAIHQEVAPLPPAEQDHWLAKAEAEQCSRADLRTAIRRARLGAAADARGSQPDGSVVLLADDGPLRLTCAVVDGQVTLTCARPARWLGGAPEEIRALIRLLEDRLRTAEAVATSGPAEG